MNTQVIVFNSVTANGAQASVSSDGLLTISGAAIIPNVSNILKNSSSTTAYTASVAQVATSSVSAANSTEYILQITSFKKSDGARKTWVFRYVSDASATALEISTNLIAQVNADDDIPVVAAASTNDFTLTAEAPYYKFAYASVGTGSLGITTSTPGVEGSETLGSQIIAYSGYPASQLSDIVTTNEYTETVLQFANPTIKDSLTSSVNDQFVIYTNQGGTDYTSLVGTYGTITQAIQGVQATWTTAGGDASVTNGVITLGGSDVFYGNTDTNIGLTAGDVVIIGGVAYPIISILSGTTAATSGTPNDASAAATKYVKLRKIA